MAEYIKRVDALKVASLAELDVDFVIEAIRHIPAADVRPLVRGNWTIDGKCSVCGEEPLTEFDVELMNFCPNCGAKMEENNE